MARRAAVSKDVTGDPMRARVEVRHEFTTDEWKAKTDHLTRLMKDVELKEEAIKANAATAKAEVKNLKAEVNDLANQLRNGYEMVQVDAFVEFKRKQGKKVLRYNAPGKPEHKKMIREESMSEADYEALPLDVETTEPAKATPEGKPPVEAQASETGGTESGTILSGGGGTGE
jgi:HAMP domain-containing protein